MDCGADRIELDVHFSKDERLMVHHDYYLGSTDDGKGLIFDHDLDYLKSLDAGDWFSPKFSGERIPLLDEVFQKVGDKVEYEIQLKGLLLISYRQC